MKIRKRPADAVVGNRQLSARVLGLPYDRFWVERRMAALLRPTCECFEPVWRSSAHATVS
jgi:hypothetical protein